LIISTNSLGRSQRKISYTKQAYAALFMVS
jgi:hypothetical protein